MLKDDINKQIDLVENSIQWAKKYNKNDTFPIEKFRQYRRSLRKLSISLNEKCSAVAYGESQVGKSYLMSSLLSSPNQPFVIENKGQKYSFIDAINPSGGQTTKTESTGVVTRFTLDRGNEKMKDYVKVRNLTLVDIILLLSDSYYNDVKIGNEIITSDKIDAELKSISDSWTDSNANIQTYITEDDIQDIKDYLKYIGAAAQNITNSHFCNIVSDIITRVPSNKWVDIFCLLWNKNESISKLFTTLIEEYKKIGFQEEIYVPFDAVLESKGTLLKIDWLDTIFNKNIDTGNYETTTKIYDKDGNILAENFNKGFLSALIAELTFEVSKNLANDRPFLEHIDLLDFPGARSREKVDEENIGDNLPTILRRGKVAYLFNKYSRALMISSVLFCHHNDQKGQPTVGEAINDWINNNISKDPNERAKLLKATNGIPSLFFIATKFNIDLKKIKTDSGDKKERLSDHWKRFDKTIPELLGDKSWMDNWTNDSAFKNIYPLRDFFWSKDNQLFDGYSDDKENFSPENRRHEFPEYPTYWDDLKESFLNNEFVKKHFSNPEQTWEDVATINNDGSKAIIDSLNKIALCLDIAREEKYKTEAISIEKRMYKDLSNYFEPDDKQEKNKKLKKITLDMKRDLPYIIGEKPEIFGHIIDSMMILVNTLRDIAYNIVICKTDTPRNFSQIDFMSKHAKIDSSDDKNTKIKKLCKTYECENESQLEIVLQKYSISIDDFISEKKRALSTIGGVVAEHIVEAWVDFLNK